MASRKRRSIDRNSDSLSVDDFRIEPVTEAAEKIDLAAGLDPNDPSDQVVLASIAEGTRRSAELFPPVPQPAPARRHRLSPVWRTEANALDHERARFLVTLDRVAPDVWQELIAEGVFRDVEQWAERHHVGVWVVPYVKDRLRRAASLDPSKPATWRASPWKRLGRGRIPELPEAFRAPPIYDPQVISRDVFLRKVELYVERVERAALRTQLAQHERARDEDLHRLVRWQVLGQSPETIATSEGLGHAALKTRAEDIRTAVTRLAARLGLPPRPRGRPGRPRKIPG